MGWLDGKVAIVTGAARGIGRQHALLLASEGAKVVVNDQGSSVSWDTYDPIDGSDLNGYGGVGPDGVQASGDGDGAGDAGPGPADAVVAEIQAKGGEAIANGEDVADWDGGKRLIDAALDAFGDLHVLVNNAGILRDRFLVNMTEEEWDSVIQVVLKGHFVPLRHAATYWRERSKEGNPVNASVINTSSTSGLLGNPGQINYGAAKAGIGALTVIAAEELVRYGVRVNAIVPAARTRLTEAALGLGEIVAPPADPGRFDEWDPANVAPLVGWLASEACSVTGRVFYTFGGTIALMGGWTRSQGVSKPGRWTIAEIATEIPSQL
jgi:NAD(P)-dependent dehydrogenase (short-subunit alcohol dehydrogenase family)